MISTDGQTTVVAPRTNGRKPGQRKRKINQSKVNSDFAENLVLWCFRTMMMILLIILFLFLPVLVAVDPKVRQDCPDKQVLHVDPENKVSFCCIPVDLFKGYEFVSCQNNGTHDSTRRCKEGLFQEDDTTTASEATCIAQLQCVAKENLQTKKCDAEGENCVTACVCNFPEEFCGTVYYDCRPFPKDCPKEYVQENCSCNKPPYDGSATGITIKQPGSDVISQKNSTMPSSKVPFIPTTGKPGINTTIDTDLNVKNNASLNDNSSRAGLGPEKSGFSIPVVIVVVVAVVVIVVIIGIVVFRNKEYRDFLHKKVLCIYRNCRRRSEPKPVPKRPVAAVKPLVQNLSQADGGAQSFHLLVVNEDTEDAQNVDAQRIPSIVLPIDGIKDEQAVAFVEPPSNVSGQSGIVLSMEGWVPLSTISSNGFDSNDTDQNCDNTHVKEVECVIDETERKQVVENQHNGVEENPQSETTYMPPVDSRFQSSTSAWSSFSRSINNSSSGQIVSHPPGDVDRQEQEEGNKDNEDEPQETEECEESPFLDHINKY